MGCWKFLLRPSDPPVLLLLGMENSGKTSVSLRLRNEFQNPTTSWGFSVHSAFIYPPKRKRTRVKLYDVGGGPRIRGIWPHYFAEAYGVIFVVDASKSECISESKALLHEAYLNPKLRGKPLLIFANKQDLNDAYSSSDLYEVLDVRSLELDMSTERTASRRSRRKVSAEGTNVRIQQCSAAVQSHMKNGIDPHIHDGLNWIVGKILDFEDELISRVKQDLQEELEIRNSVQSGNSELGSNNKTADFPQHDLAKVKPLTEIKPLKSRELLHGQESPQIADHAATLMINLEQDEGRTEAQSTPNSGVIQNILKTHAAVVPEVQDLPSAAGDSLNEQESLQPLNQVHLRETSKNLSRSEQSSEVANDIGVSPVSISRTNLIGKELHALSLDFAGKTAEERGTLDGHHHDGISFSPRDDTSSVVAVHDRDASTTWTQHGISMKRPKENRMHASTPALNQQPTSKKESSVQTLTADVTAKQTPAPTAVGLSPPVAPIPTAAGWLSESKPRAMLAPLKPVQYIGGSELRIGVSISVPDLTRS
ncbi:P-loop containing nucleoside triphosphate hydrolase protein [Cladochytrium replicatum]|nr:P-loop containing nucleoside triphosphate hydrolase protein [Cladochytrium replicatum]